MLYIYHKLRYISLGRNLGFSIGLNTLGYGVVIPHYGTIIVGSPAKIGNYCVLQACTCVSGNKKIIGDALIIEDFREKIENIVVSYDEKLRELKGIVESNTEIKNSNIFYGLLGAISLIAIILAFVINNNMLSLSLYIIFTIII